jgi:ATP-dependent helicase STH1/SNF2
LLEDKFDEDSDADEEADDEELNEMLKRSDQELVIFRRMDLERERAETDMYRRLGYHKKLERLIQEEELPEIFTQEQNPMVEQQMSVFDFGRGRRVRDEVRYDDGLTEDEFLNVR